jgi:hypothetical protein
VYWLTSEAKHGGTRTGKVYLIALGGGFNRSMQHCS